MGEASRRNTGGVAKAILDGMAFVNANKKACRKGVASTSRTRNPVRLKNNRALRL